MHTRVHVCPSIFLSARTQPVFRPHISACSTLFFLVLFNKAEQQVFPSDHFLSPLIHLIPLLVVGNSGYFHSGLLALIEHISRRRSPSEARGNENEYLYGNILVSTCIDMMMCAYSVW